MTSQIFRVGIADDDPLIRCVLTRALGTSPFLQVVAAVEDGGAAVQLALSGTVDVIVLDVEMPGMNGREALLLIRRFAPAVRVVVHSSLAASCQAEEMVLAGASAYLEKPCDLARLVEVICGVGQLRGGA